MCFVVFFSFFFTRYILDGWVSVFVRSDQFCIRLFLSSHRDRRKRKSIETFVNSSNRTDEWLPICPNSKVIVAHISFSEWNRKRKYHFETHWIWRSRRKTEMDYFFFTFTNKSACERKEKTFICNRNKDDLCEVIYFQLGPMRIQLISVASKWYSFPEHWASTQNKIWKQNQRKKGIPRIFSKINIIETDVGNNKKKENTKTNW